MNPDQSAAYRALQQAQQARKTGNKRLARQYAEQAARLAPESEDVWLMMAALASPRASVVFMEKALQINPQSERVRQGMHWAVERLRKEPLRKHVYASVAARPMLVKKPATQARIIYSAAVLLTVLSLVTAWAILNATPAAASFINSSLFTNGQNAPAWAPVDVAKPTYTLTTLPTSTATVVPSATSTFVSSPTETDTPLPTETPTETSTPIPSNTPTTTPTELPSPTPLATDIIYPSPTPLPTDAMSAASPTPLPTDTTVPAAAPTRSIPITVQNNPGGNGGAHWIDVNLTNQMVYAYEGDSVVNSFVVSTGTWQHPTVTGQYHIYIKYRYKDMSGPGYFLPNVPWTMFFYQGYALHGTYWHSNFGTPMSHGCVNLSIPDAEWLYNFSSVGTLVNIHY